MVDNTILGGGELFLRTAARPRGGSGAEDQSNTCSIFASLSRCEHKREGLDSDTLCGGERDPERELELARESAGMQRRPLGVVWIDPVSTVEDE